MCEWWTIPLLTSIVYGSSVGYGMIVDDTSVWGTLPRRKGNVWNLRRIFSDMKWSFTIHSLVGDRILCLAIHTSVCLLIYEMWGFAPAALFAVHPVSLSVAVWLNGKRYGWNTLIVLSVLRWFPWTLPLVLLIPHFQANAIPLPLLLTRYHPLSVLLCFTLLLPLLPQFVGWWEGRAKVVEKGAVRLERWKWRIVVGTLSYYLVNSLTARRVGFYHEYLDALFEIKERTEYWLRRPVWFPCVLLSTYLGVMVVGWQSGVGEGLWWWFTFSLVFSNWTSPTQTITDRYQYLPTIGLVFFVTSLDLPPVLLVGWGLYLLTRTIEGKRAYINKGEFIDYHFIHSPKASKAWIVKVVWEKGLGHGETAMKICAEGIRRFPWCTKLFWQGIVLLQRFDYRLASEVLASRDADWLVRELDNVRERLVKGDANEHDSTIRGA